MSDTLRETEAQVRAAMPSYAWEIMDDDQRDAYVKKVIAKRYMKRTKDGVDLGPSWWGKALGCTPKTITMRVSRIKAADQGEPARAGHLSDAERAHIRGAAAALRKHPEAIYDVLKHPEALEAATDAVLSGAGQTGTRSDRHHAERRGLDVIRFLTTVSSACERAIKHLPDFAPDADDKAEAKNTAEWCNATSEFLADWIAGRNIADEVDAYLGGD